MSLPTDPTARKQVPLATGLLDYFPRALAAVATCSQVGNDQHNPGTPLHWDRSKSGDEADALMRHFMERGRIDTDGQRHSTKVAWRALALLEKELETTWTRAQEEGCMGQGECDWLPPCPCCGAHCNPLFRAGAYWCPECHHEFNA